MEACEQIPFDREAHRAEQGFRVTLTFFLKRDRMPLARLDNLVRPVLDTVFRIRQPSPDGYFLTGAIIWQEPNAIEQLTLIRKMVETPEEAGVDLLIEWD
jgi:hypothetical protein